MEPARLYRADSTVYRGLGSTWPRRFAGGGIRLWGLVARIGDLSWAGSDGMDSSSHGRHLGAKLRTRKRVRWVYMDSSSGATGF